MSAKPENEREPVTHDLKTWPQYFRAVKSGVKRFELRKHDRDFRVGDTLRLREWCPVDLEYTGDEVSHVVSYLLEDGDFAIPGLVVMCWSDAIIAQRESGGAEPVAWRPLLDKCDLTCREVIDHPDAYLGAALDFSRSILAHCIANGLKARDLADGFQHLESAVRGLHARALRSGPAEAQARVDDLHARLMAVTDLAQHNNLGPLGMRRLRALLSGSTPKPAQEA